MNSDGTQDAWSTHAHPVPRPATPPEPPAVPPKPVRPPEPPPAGRAAPSAVADWLDQPRPAARTGIWRFGHRPAETVRTAERIRPITVVGMLIPLALALVLWSLWLRGAVPYWWAPLRFFTPDDWWETLAPSTPVGSEGAHARVVYDGVFFALLVLVMSNLGSWPGVVRHFFARREQPARAGLAALAALLTLTFVFPSAFPGVFWDPLPVVSPLFSLIVLITGSNDFFFSAWKVNTAYTVITLLVLWPFARLGGWWPLARTWLAARTGTAEETGPQPPAEQPPSRWPALREAGQHQAADVLGAEVAAGRMNDVDVARVTHAWTAARTGGRPAAFTDAVLRHGAATAVHPSGARDLPGRTARHDLLTGQVRIGQWVKEKRTPPAYADAGAALGPDTLGTSLLVVGPSGAGKTRRVIAPLAESLALQALTGSCAVVAVCAAGTPLGPDAAFDVVIRVGDPSSVHDLDPYAEADDPDEAAAFLAEALVGDLDAAGTRRRAVTALAQLLGPYRAAYGTFPTLPVLRELLLGEPPVLTALREALADERGAVMRRELDARLRQADTPGDPGPELADRLASLDRPVFADFFGAGDGTTRPFSLRAVAHHPLRVRIDLPGQGHEEAARLITRLVLAQFTAVAQAGDGRAHFACLLLDDAAGAVTEDSVRRIQRLRTRDAGVVLALRSIAEVPEALHGPLYGAVGCRMACSGVTTWDGGRFADAWGTEWVETEDVAQHTVFADQPMTRALHALRKMVTGKEVTTKAVTVRQVERERWSASELAHDLPPGHAVLSLTSVRGEHAPPLLVDLRG
ncbi:ATP/GTP-binding protein [Streptomyces sp. CRN 30]|uniref:ATP/GTP-binding protein n=1 Tax=Streptomyces sp. CRN 30 TaxID=3075613 RepID=UPI002A823519|nr:ATP/GTP-binding protein [Streptomyces sp. CRN 30]